MKLLFPVSFCILSLFLSLSVSSQSARAETPEPGRSMLVLDASGSMWGQIDGKAKIEIAREALDTLFEDWPENQEVGLIAYGHRKKGDCDDIEQLLPVAALEKEGFTAKVKTLKPKGMTPLSQAVINAAEALKYSEQKATVILLSDGIETCEKDPCAVGSELESLGVDFTAHVIGFDVTEKQDQAGLRCLAENTGGVFYPAADAAQLNEALEKVAEVSAAAPLEAQPEEVQQVTATMTAAERATLGTSIKITFESDPLIESSYVYLFKKGQDDSLGSKTVYSFEDGYREVEFPLPAKTGEYVLRWKRSENEIFSESALTIIDTKIEILAAREAVGGTELEFELAAPSGMRGYVHIYPKDRDDSLGYVKVIENDEEGYAPRSLRLPARPGAYTLSWVISKETVATADLQITEPEVRLETEEQAPVATEVSIQPIAPEGLDGYIYLYPEGQEKSVTYVKVLASEAGYKNAKIRLPARPGRYSLKWLTRGKELLAETTVEATASEVSIESKDEVVQGSLLEFGVKGPEGMDGYVYIYPKGSDSSVAYTKIRVNSYGEYERLKLQLPFKTGEFDLKWLSRNKETLASKSIKLIPAEVELDFSEAVEAGAEFTVGIKAPQGLSGYLYVFPKDAEKSLTYKKIRTDAYGDYEPLELTAPEKRGEYEVRWLTTDKEVVVAKELIVDGPKKQ